MFKKSDTLPLILAFVTTVLIVTLGFSWLESSKFGKLGLFARDSNGLRQNNDSDLSNAQTTESLSAVDGSQKKFAVPVIVPQGTSVTINGSQKLNQVNQALRRSFHRQYPGTVITTKSDGSTVGLDLLYSRAIDIAALESPLKSGRKRSRLKTDCNL